MSFDLARIGANLPVLATLPELEVALAESGAAVVQAPPGTGKTTLVPPFLHCVSGEKILVTGPRRVAVRAAARRLAQASSTRLGELVGYSVRGDHTPGSAVEFLTPGVLVRRLLADPELPGISAVVVDEVHERQLDSDLALTMLAELRQLRDNDFRVVAMSATVDAQRFAEFLHAPIVTTPAVAHPVAVQYAPAADRLRTSRAFLDHVCTQATGHKDATLVFLPGVREVNYLCEKLGAVAVPLHGRQTPAEQDAAFAEGYRIVVATGIAESSVTVPGVRVVIDAGLARVPRRDTARGMTGLVTESCTRSQAEQRAGRAGREGPGTVIRCYSEREFQHFSPHITPEIHTCDLTQAALLMACWGPLELIDAPPASALTSARATLTQLGALHDGRVTDLGRRLARMPADPRLTRALIDAAPAVGSRAAARAVATLAYGDPSEARRFERFINSHPDTGADAFALVTALAFPERIAKRLNESTVLLASGTRANTTDPHGDWLAIAEVTRSGETAKVRKAFPLAENDALRVLGVAEETVAELDEQGRVQGRRIRKAGAIELSATPVPLDARTRWDAVAAGYRAGTLPLPEDQQRIRERLAYLHARLGAPWPAVNQDTLHARLTEWLNPDLSVNLRNLIPWDLVATFDAAAPTHLTVPSGRKHKVTYSAERAVVAVKLQECFGLAKSPLIAGQQVQFHLLSPAGRPLAITSDLRSFWAGPYAEVRKEMRGRYPKHPWPEDPWAATATAATTRASRSTRAL